VTPTLRLAGESWLGVWGRRAVSIPLVFSLAAIVLCPLLLWLVLAAGIDLVRGSKKRWPSVRVLLFFALYLGCEVLGVIASFLVWLRCFGRNDVERNATLQRYFSDALFFGAVRLFSMTVEVSGDVQGAPFLLFVRHASTADSVLAAALLANRQRLRLRYVLKRELLWDPCLDIVGRRLPNAFVERSKNKAAADIAALVKLATALDTQSAVLIFPEGTRFSPQKLAAARAKLVEQGHDSLAHLASGYRNVLPPKLGGPLALLEAAPGVDVVFLEHSGFEGARSFDRFIKGDLIGRTIHARFRRISARDIPNERRAEWLFEQWRECDRFVTSHVEHLKGHE
jgi:1-acyl-sn-glycerol-3-phosphate acyltransferase